MARALVAAAAAYVVANLVAWAAFRIDKRRARTRAWRIPERVLLMMSAIGVLGALWAMYGHRQRHKVNKRGFVAIVWLELIAQVAIAVTVVTLRRR
ncbi:MAG: DUF1294 domain-containing protein [Deltaproteobacteria bacterium]|nr:DUF1294 domain-containing protein [Deltaproteobacteria bacterium]